MKQKLPSWVTDFISEEDFYTYSVFYYIRKDAIADRDALHTFKANLVMLGCREANSGYATYLFHHDLGVVLRERYGSISLDVFALRRLLP